MTEKKHDIDISRADILVSGGRGVGAPRGGSPHRRTESPLRKEGAGLRGRGGQIPAKTGSKTGKEKEINYLVIGNARGA